LFGEEALAFVDRLIDGQVTAPAHLSDPRTIRPYMLRTIAFALQRGNGGIVSEGVDLNLGR
jgi:hypothetical protein